MSGESDNYCGNDGEGGSAVSLCEGGGKKLLVFDKLWHSDTNVASSE